MKELTITSQKEPNNLVYSQIDLFVSFKTHCSQTSCYGEKKKKPSKSLWKDIVIKMFCELVFLRNILRTVPIVVKEN